MPNFEPKLSHSEFLSVDHVDDLVKLYSQKEKFFSDREDFLDFVSRDWTHALETSDLEGLFRDEIPVSDVLVDGTEYKIFGISFLKPNFLHTFLLVYKK